MQQIYSCGLGQNPDVYDFLVFSKIFIHLYKDLSTLMLVETRISFAQSSQRF